MVRNGTSAAGPAFIRATRITADQVRGGFDILGEDFAIRSHDFPRLPSLFDI